MRQAGRYQPEYRVIRQKYSLVEICHHPDVCAEVTMLPVQQLGVDAAILFSYIMIPLAPMGVDFQIKEGIGPVMASPVRSEEQVEALRPLEPTTDLPYVMETIKILKQELAVPLIGFAGGPFTLASYMVEGAPSRNYLQVKTMMYRTPDLWHKLMTKLASMVATYLNAQVAAGASVVQVFDSWVGNLSPVDYNTYVLPHMQTLFSQVRSSGAPAIHFGVGTATLLPLMRQAGGDCIGLDWKTPLRESWATLGYDVAVQGNIDPTLLFAPTEVWQQQARSILSEAEGQPGHIFNLGHGILPTTPVETAQQLVAFVHEASAR
jgi:uroporphyrinogen decarboxylase